MTQETAYKLSNVLLGHNLDIRSLASIPDSADFVVSASRDCSAKLWKLDVFNPEATSSYKGHDKYVSCVCVIPATPNQPVTILTGSNDNTICAFSVETGEILFRLTGHENAVCCLWVGSSGRVLSSSWDGTARVWQGQQEVAKLEGHSMSVWAVTELPGNAKIVTASADKTIKIWTNETCEQTLTGHEDCVRGVAPVSDVEFLSCANDATVRLWKISGECMGVFYGHSNYIYSVSVLPDGGFVTCGEDHCVRVWKANGETSQIINIPAQSVWCVLALLSGDIAAGSSDGVVRVFSQNPARHGNEDSQATFTQEVESFMKSKKLELGGVKVTDLPGKETLYAPGSHDGQTKMVREGDKVICYQWSASKCLWDCIGEAVGAGPEASEGKTSYRGKEYDFVFNVDIEDGKPPLKLPYNKDDDPWVSAQKFIHDNDLSQMFLDTIANFIIKNSGQGQVSSASGSSQYVDPFTGGSRYVPGSGPSSGSASRQVNADPFTGGSSYNSAGPSKSSVSLPTLCDYHLFEQANLDGITVKLKEFNKSSWQSLDEADIVALAKLAEPGNNPDPQDLQNLQQLLTWNPDRLFPVLDLARLAIRNLEVNKFLCSEPYSNLLISSVLRPNLTPQTPEITRLMALRFVVNMLAHASGEKLATKNAEFLLSVANQLSLPNSKPSPRQQVALTTLLFNLSVASLKSYPEVRKITLPIAALVLQRLTDTEAQRRCLRTLSNLLNNAGQELLNQAKEKKLPETLANLMSEPKVADMAAQLLSALP